MEIGAAIFFTDYSITPTEPVQAMSHLALRIICRGGAGWSSSGMTSGGRLRFENLVARGKSDPRLLAAGPDVPGRPQP
jgi:hypothetical protein